MPTYRTYEGQTAPTWLRQPYGQAFVRAQGILHDSNKILAKFGVRARFPQYGPPDGVAALGAERFIPASPSESTSSYGARVKNAWGYWSIGGTAWGILAILAGMGYSSAYIACADGQVYGPSSGVSPPVPGVGTRQVSGNGSPWGIGPVPNPVAGTPPTLSLQRTAWTFSSQDGQGNYSSTTRDSTDYLGDFWSRCCLVFSPAPSSWSGSPPAPGAGWPDELNLLRSVLATWKSGVASMMGIAVAVGTSSGAARAMFDFPLGRTFTGDGAGTFATQVGTLVYLY